MLGLTALAMSGAAIAKLPAPSPEAKAKADEAKNKTTWSDKVAAFQLCKAQNKVAEQYLKSKGGDQKPEADTSCTDPGPYLALVAGQQVGVADAKPVPAAGKAVPGAETKK
ncbi:hypothetical protein D3870_16980 [Noviherbaspirillum cavernae]|uniref:Uncharacterized protein n=2 Tax=Noviherbaspirillum cavernae TaxID=2320862 RepID=A0A418X714_9BURK|nr:hypothetical protein D3870_16980 [Noviherbaspirillum cavernae]